MLSSRTDPRGPARRILLASYYFPPDAAVGGLRIAKFARHLAELGWEPHVLTADDRLKESGFDPDRCQGLERVPVVHTGELPRVIERIGRVKVLNPRRRPTAGESLPARESGEPFARRLTRYVVSLLVLLPDEKKNWSLRAAFTAVRLIKQKQIGWILTSGPPFSGHVIGLAAKVLTGTKWVADFRDPWIDMLRDRFPHTRSGLSDALERWMESLVVRFADRIVTTTDRMRQAMTARYPEIPAEHFFCSPNSIDVEKIQSGDADDSYDKLTITYAGSLYFDRTPEPLFEAVSQLIRSGRATPSDVRIRLLGYCREINGVDTDTGIRRYGLEDVVSVVDRVAHAAAVEIMRRSHLLLLLAPERHRLVVPAKIYDYLGTGRVVLALAEPGATADLMNEMQCGPCFAHADVEGIRNYLATLLESGRYRTLRSDPGRFSRYHARSLTGALAKELDRMRCTSAPEVMVRT